MHSLPVIRGAFRTCEDCYINVNVISWTFADQLCKIKNGVPIHWLKGSSLMMILLSYDLVNSSITNTSKIKKVTHYKEQIFGMPIASVM